jgi:nucleotide-binding universal stress UspA family protein
VVDSENFIESDLAIYQLETTQHYIQEKGITCSIKLLQENASTAKTILTYADEEKIDIIMLMTQQEANIKQWFVGSTAKEIIHHSKIPVLSIAPNIVEK